MKRVGQSINTNVVMLRDCGAPTQITTDSTGPSAINRRPWSCWRRPRCLRAVRLDDKNSWQGRSWSVPQWSRTPSPPATRMHRKTDQRWWSQL